MWGIQKQKKLVEYVNKRIANIVNLATEYNVDGRSYGKTWLYFLQLKLIELGDKAGKKAIDEICKEIEEYIKSDLLGIHSTPNNQKIKRWIDSKYFKGKEKEENLLIKICKVLHLLKKAS